MSLLSTSTFAPEDEGPFYIFERYEVLKKYYWTGRDPGPDYTDSLESRLHEPK